MLRKIVAVFLALATVVMLFTACDGNDVEITTGPISTGDVSTSEPPIQKPASYILTTAADKTVPWLETTRFETTTADYNTLITMPTDTIDVPPVNIITTGSSLPTVIDPGTTNPSSSNTSASSTTKPTSSTTEKPTTTEPEKYPTAVIIDSEGYNSSSGKLYLGISPSGWSSDIKANSTSISIKIDGVTSTSKVTCSVTAAKNSDGMQEIVIDLSSQSVTSGSTVSYTIPEGFLVSKTGTQYNTSYSSSATI